MREVECIGTTSPAHGRFHYHIEAYRLFRILVQFAVMVAAARYSQPIDCPVSEVAEILAAGLMRLLARQSSQISALNAEKSLDISAAESGHPTPENGRSADG